LDATIVSAIIQDNKVVEIIFITNSDIDNGTQIDIEKALKNAIGESFNAVHFKTKLDIEFWLYNNPDMYENYFDDNRESLLNIKFDKIIVSGFISFFNPIRQSIHFREPLKELRVGEIYDIIFSLFSPCEKKGLSLKINTDLIKIFLKSIDVKQGNNRICIKGKCLKTGIIPRYFISINGTKIETYGKPLIKEPNILLQIKSQNNIEKLILKSLCEFKESNHSSIHIIKGRGGIGKSTLIENLLKSGQFEGLDVIYQSFSKDSIDSSILLINIVLSILFYHSAPSLIDVEYLKQLEDRFFVGSFLKDLIKSKNNIERQQNEENIEILNLKISEYTDSKELFPNFIELNKKVIILDDLHKLDSLSRTFLFDLLSDIYTSKVNCFIVLCARNSFWETSQYLNFIEINKVDNYNYEFTNDDLHNNIQLNDFHIDKNVLSIFLDRIDLDIFFAISLIKFLNSNSEFLKKSNSDARLALINSFIAEDKHTESILTLFKYLSETEKEILRIIYFSLTGVDKSHIKTDYIDIFEKIELSGLAIINNDCKYAPFHDIYQDVFKRAYLPPSISVVGKYLNSLPSEYEIKRDSLLFSNKMDSDQQNEILKSIKLLIRNHKFYTSLYILAPIFADTSIRKTNDVDRRKKSQLGEVCYYNLQFYYAYSVANCDKNIGGKEEFYRLYKKIRTNINPEIKCVLVKTLSELINSSFEHLALSDVDNYSNELYATIRTLEIEGYVKNSQPFFLLTKEIELLTCLMLDKLENTKSKYEELVKLCSESNDSNKLEIVNIRYARSIYHCNVEHAYNMINNSVKSLIDNKSTEIKWILLGQFEMCFIQILMGTETSIKPLKQAFELLKENFFNDYKKESLVIVACYIFFGMKEQAYQYLYDNYFDKRKMRPRFKAIRLSFLSIFECIFNNDTKTALEYLKEQQDIFCRLGDSYTTIINHNIKAIKQYPTIKEISFYTGNKELSEKSLYIDPRIW
jgi:hypothetical protein